MASLAALFRGRKLKEVWLDVDVRTAILDRAARRSLLAADQWVTEQALDAIAQFAKLASLQQSLWDTCGQTLCEALSFNGWCTSGPVKCALRALVMLSHLAQAQAEMGFNHQLLKAVWRLQSTQPDLRKITLRLCASLAEFPDNLPALWNCISESGVAVLREETRGFPEALRFALSFSHHPKLFELMLETPDFSDMVDRARQEDQPEDVQDAALHLLGAIRWALAARWGPAVEKVPVVPLPPTELSGTLSHGDRITVQKKWVKAIATIVKHNESTITSRQHAAAAQHSKDCAAAWGNHRLRVSSSLAELSKDLMNVKTRANVDDSRIREADTEVQAQRETLALSMETLAEAVDLATLAKEQQSQSKRKATDASQDNTRTKRGRSDARTPLASAAGPAPRARPDHHMCPITHEVMTDPVVAADGLSYERSAITEWLEKSTRSPMHNTVLKSVDLFPNVILRQIVEDWAE